MFFATLGIFKDMMYINLRLTVLILLMLGLGTIKTYSQLPPELVSPDDAEKCLPRSISFDWEASMNAVGYILQVSDIDGDFSSPVFQSAPLTSTAQFYELEDNLTEYYWRVASLSSSNTFWSESRTFTTQASPLLLFVPPGESVCQEKQMILHWEEYDGAISYNVQIATNIGFSNFITNTTAALSSSFTRLLPDNDAKYYWRISANYLNGGVNCQTEWSEVRNYTTKIAPPNDPTPAQDSIGLPLVLDISWNNVTNGIFYNFEIASDDNFQNIVSSSYSIVSTSASVDLGTNFNSDYYWRVATIDDPGCLSDWSSTFHFKTIAEKPILLEPENEAVCVPVNNAYFSWEPVSEANAYRLQISLDIAFNDTENNIANISSTFRSTNLSDDVTTFYWRVRAEDGVTIGAWSDTREFKSGIFDTEVISPANNAEEVYIEATLQWGSNSVYTNNWLQVSPTVEFEESTLIFNDSTLNVEEVKVVMPDYVTTYYWRTSSTYGECYTNWSEPAAFTTIKGSPDLLLPEDNAINQPLVVDFDWKDIPMAQAYRIEVSENSDFSGNKIKKIGFSTSAIQIVVKAETKYYWHVRTLHQVSTGEEKMSPWSETFEFTTNVAPSGVPLLESPEHNSKMIARSSDFFWSEVEGADSYNFELALDNDFPIIAHSITSIQSNSFSLSSASISLENYQTYFWRVNAQNNSGPSDWSSVWEFRTIAPAVIDVVVLKNPESEAGGVNPENIAFSWFEVDNTLEYKGGYKIQVATSSSFSGDELKIDFGLIWKGNKTIPLLDAETSYFWRVHGWNEAGAGPWSDVWAFETGLSSALENNFVSKLQISPNPANERTLISFDSKQSGNAQVLVYDMNGNLVSTIYSGMISRGSEQQFTLNSTKLSSGKYMLVIRTAGKIAAKQFSVIR